MKNEDYELAKETLALDKGIDFKDSFYLTKICGDLLSNKETEKEGRDLAIRALDKIKYLHPSTHEIWNSFIESAGLYPYFSYTGMSTLAQIRFEYHKSKYLENVYFHEEQRKISMLLQMNKSLIVSAPTSFGKSILIEELIASKKYRNIVIIQPTLALLEETRKKLQKYRNDYNIIVSTSQKDLSERNIFLFTGERVVEYKNFPQIEFFIIDEFYKLSMDRDDERSIALNYALYKLLKMTKKFYMLGPNVNSIPEGFDKKYNALFEKTDYATVAVDIVDVDSIESTTTVEQREQKLFDLLLNLNESTIIYCSSPEKVNELVEKFLAYSQTKLPKTNAPEVNNLAQWIDENVHKDWILRKAIVNSIGQHHGAIPRHLASSIVDLFNNQKIKYLFCTSTLIEGVNTSAKNVIFFHNKKGLKSIDYFDAKNIVGRAGRMKWHYVGKIYNFNKQPEEVNVNVDIPIYTQDDAPLDLLIQMEKNDLKEESKKKLEDFDSLEPEMQNLLKENQGIPLDSQEQLVARLENDDELYEYLAWDAIPELEKLEKVIELALLYLIRKGDTKKYSAKKLAVKILQSIQFGTLNAVIMNDFNRPYWVKEIPDSNERLQTVIQEALDINQNWFEYKLPKLISIMSNIQEYVYKKKGLKPGNYNALSGFIENKFLPPHLTILLDYGIPASAIKKISSVIKESNSVNEIIGQLKIINYKEINLLNYEIEKIKLLTKE